MDHDKEVGHINKPPRVVDCKGLQANLTGAGKGGQACQVYVCLRSEGCASFCMTADFETVAPDDA